jgi:hypothetical protein
MCASCLRLDLFASQVPLEPSSRVYDCVEELIVAVQNLVDGYLSGQQGYPPALDGLRSFRFEIGQGPCYLIEMRLAEVRAQLNTELWKVMPRR